MAETPSWDDLKALIGSHPKPPLSARVVESGVTEREATVLFDGVDTWHIVVAGRVELSSAASTTIRDGSDLETMRGFGGAASNTWVKVMIQGRLAAYLDESQGRVVESDEIEGRACWVADVAGLRDDDPSTEFRHWIDAETGVILRMVRLGDVEAVAELRDIAFGEVVEPEPLA